MWKRAKIFPILKKGKPPTEASSDRPISLTPAISKVYEMVINATVKKVVSENNMSHNQFGFTHQRSTTHVVHKVANDIASSTQRPCGWSVSYRKGF